MEGGMLITFSLDNKSEMEQWDVFVKSHPNGTPYHLSIWLRIIYETYSFKPLMSVSKNDDGGLTGILPCFLIKSIFTGSRVVSIPFSDYGGPLVNDKFEENCLFKEIIQSYGREVNYIEIRNSNNDSSGFLSHNHYKRHVLNLQADLSEIKKGIDKKTILYSIRKAQNAGVIIKEENNQFGIDEFYRLNLLTRKKHGVPPQPKKFLNKILDHIISKGDAFILLAVYDSKVIAASIFIKFGKQMYYKYNASDPEYLKKTSPNHLIVWHVIKKGVAEGFHSIDFGRTSSENKGLLRFKEMWGMNPVDCCYNYYPKIQGMVSKKESSRIYRFLTSTWGFIPERVIEKIGPMVYKHTA